MFFETLIYFVFSGIAFILATRPFDRSMDMKKSLVVNSMDIVKSKKSGYRLVLASSINFVVSTVLLLVFIYGSG